MRANKVVAQVFGVSRRDADLAIATGQVKQDGKLISPGDQLTSTVMLSWQGHLPVKAQAIETIVIDKPVGFVCSKDGQGSQTIYSLVPAKYANFFIAGRLDKDSSGLVILTNDGQLAQELSHPSNDKLKIYNIKLNKDLDIKDINRIRAGVKIDDTGRLSKMKLIGEGKIWKVSLTEGRNRQIRKTFSAVGYEVIDLRRVKLGEYTI